MPESDLPYLDRIDELEKVEIVRLKGKIGQEMIPIIESRIQENRKKGSKIDKNVLVDYAKVEDLDTATVAFHLVRLKEYEAEGFKIGFINASEKLKTLIEMFKQTNTFQMYPNEEVALSELNQ